MNTNHGFALQIIQKTYASGLYKEADVKKYHRLYKAIKNCIEKGELPESWLLPPTRLLSESLGISRATVIKAYELLSLEKLIIAKKGSGYKVNFSLNTTEIALMHHIAREDYPNISENGKSYLENISLINRLPDAHIAFRPGLPPLDVFPINQWKTLLNNYWRYVKTSGLSYSKSTGLSELKKSVSAYLKVSRNVNANPNQIVIVSGSLQSLYLIANTLINPTDEVVLENAVFPNVHSVFKSAKAKIIPLPLDQDGLAIQDYSFSPGVYPKLVHVTPSNHYPTGIKMSLQRRKEVLTWATKHRALIIENDYENEIANQHNPTPTIFSLDQEDRTIYVGTFNRLLHPSIRLGYMVVPSYLIRVVEALQEHSHRFVSPSIQAVMNQFIEKNYLYKHIENCLKAARERQLIFMEEFNKISTKMVLQPNLFSSFHMVAIFINKVTVEEEQKLITKLKEKKITVFSLSKCFITKPKQCGLIFGYSAQRISAMKNSIRRMQGII